MSNLFWGAALLSFITFGVHTFAGGRSVARPLLDNQSLPLPMKWLSYYCWHIATAILLFSAGGFAYSAYMPEKPELAAFCTLLAAVLALMSAAIAMKAGINPLRFPSTYLLGSVAIVGGGAFFIG